MSCRTGYYDPTSQITHLGYIDAANRRQAMFDNSDDQDLGDIWSAVGAIGASAVQLIPGLMTGGASSGGAARGLAAITAFGNQAIQTLQKILQLAPQNPQQAISDATRITNALSDPQYVYQAQHGDDANALQNFKAQAGALFQQIQATAAATLGVTPTESTQTTLPAATPTITSGIDTTTLLIAGGLLAAVLLLK